MPTDFRQQQWNDDVAAACRRLTELAVREDLGPRGIDWTTAALVPDDAAGKAAIVARVPGVLAGIRAVETIAQVIDRQIACELRAHDGDQISAGQALAVLAGPARSLLSAERIVLNFVGHLSGIATLTARYVSLVAGTGAKIYDTRKTTPGFRLLEKYAVCCGGGSNHRGSLGDAVLIKDNHLALGATTGTRHRFSPADAVREARKLIDQARAAGSSPEPLLIEVEVDTLAQLDEVLPARPDIVLLDNMTPDQLRTAVARRDAVDKSVQLEASGGVNLQTVAAIAASGVERISVGALTHSATWLDVGLDWLSE